MSVNESISKDSNCVTTGDVHLNSSLALSPVKLNSSNYLIWSQAYLLSIQVNIMHKFINGRSKQPMDDDPKLDDWKSDNAMVKTWLFNSMKPNIRKSYLFLTTTQEIWSLIEQTYSHSSNRSKSYEIRKRVYETVQGRKSLAEYYFELTGLWTELDHYRIFTMACPKDAEAYQRIVEEDRTIAFLAGLDVYNNSIKTEFIGRTPLPDVPTAHARIQGEIIRRHNYSSF